MKYLKYFESDIFRPITTDDLTSGVVSTWFGSGLEDFSLHEFNTIKSDFVKISNKNIDLGEKCILIRSRFFHRVLYKIHKLPDEWFLIHDVSLEKWFRCDQTDGVISCLSHLLKLN